MLRLSTLLALLSFSVCTIAVADGLILSPLPGTDSIYGKAPVTSPPVTPPPIKKQKHTHATSKHLAVMDSDRAVEDSLDYKVQHLKEQK